MDLFKWIKELGFNQIGTEENKYKEKVKPDFTLDDRDISFMIINNLS